MDHFNTIVIGSGIIGTATALKILEKSELSVLVIEAESSPALHQTGNNSGVIHSGLYYKPGSLKAINCNDGRNLMYRFCEENNIKFERCGKVVVAINDEQVKMLTFLKERGEQNGLSGIEYLDEKKLREAEPYVTGKAGLFIPQTGIVDYKEVVNKYIGIIKQKGGRILFNNRFESLHKSKNSLVVKTQDNEFSADLIVNCAGLYSDRVALKCGVDPGLRIFPFRGEYYKLKPESNDLVKNLIYPVPDPRFPFLGVHFTRRINGEVEAGPNAVLALKREGYKRSDFSMRDFSEMMFYPGFYKLAGKYLNVGFEEYKRSLFKSVFVKSLQELIPGISANDLMPGGAGVRAQAVDKNGNLVDDFRIVESENMVHVLNAPSPAATASLSIGNKISSIVLQKFSQLN